MSVPYRIEEMNFSFPQGQRRILLDSRRGVLEEIVIGTARVIRSSTVPQITPDMASLVPCLPFSGSTSQTVSFLGHIDNSVYSRWNIWFEHIETISSSNDVEELYEIRARIRPTIPSSEGIRFCHYRYRIHFHVQFFQTSLGNPYTQFSPTFSSPVRYSFAAAQTVFGSDGTGVELYCGSSPSFWFGSFPVQPDEPLPIEASHSAYALALGGRLMLSPNRPFCLCHFIASEPPRQALEKHSGAIAVMAPFRIWVEGSSGERLIFDRSIANEPFSDVDVPFNGMRLERWVYGRLRSTASVSESALLSPPLWREAGRYNGVAQYPGFAGQANTSHSEWFRGFWIYLRDLPLSSSSGVETITLCAENVFGVWRCDVEVESLGGFYWIRDVSGARRYRLRLFGVDERLVRAFGLSRASALKEVRLKSGGVRLLFGGSERDWRREKILYPPSLRAEFWSPDDVAFDAMVGLVSGCAFERVRDNGEIEETVFEGELESDAGVHNVSWESETGSLRVEFQNRIARVLKKKLVLDDGKFDAEAIDELFPYAVDTGQNPPRFFVRDYFVRVNGEDRWNLPVETGTPGNPAGVYTFRTWMKWFSRAMGLRYEKREAPIENYKVEVLRFYALQLTAHTWTDSGQSDQFYWVERHPLDLLRFAVGVYLVFGMADDKAGTFGEALERFLDILGLRFVAYGDGRCDFIPFWHLGLSGSASQAALMDGYVRRCLFGRLKGVGGVVQLSRQIDNGDLQSAPPGPPPSLWRIHWINHDSRFRTSLRTSPRLAVGESRVWRERTEGFYGGRYYDDSRLRLEEGVGLKFRTLCVLGDDLVSRYPFVCIESFLPPVSRTYWVSFLGFFPVAHLNPEAPVTSWNAANQGSALPHTNWRLKGILAGNAPLHGYYYTHPKLLPSFRRMLFYRMPLYDMFGNDLNPEGSDGSLRGIYSTYSFFQFESFNGWSWYFDRVGIVRGIERPNGQVEGLAEFLVGRLWMLGRHSGVGIEGKLVGIWDKIGEVVEVMGMRYEIVQSEPDYENGWTQVTLLRRRDLESEG